MPALNLQLPPVGELEAPTIPVPAADIHPQTQSKHALPVSTSLYILSFTTGLHAPPHTTGQHICSASTQLGIKPRDTNVTDHHNSQSTGPLGASFVRKLCITQLPKLHHLHAITHCCCTKSCRHTAATPYAGHDQDSVLKGEACRQWAGHSRCTSCGTMQTCRQTRGASLCLHQIHTRGIHLTICTRETTQPAQRVKLYWGELSTGLPAQHYDAPHQKHSCKLHTAAAVASQPNQPRRVQCGIPQHYCLISLLLDELQHWPENSESLW